MKGPSPLIAFDIIDMIDSLAIDSMHNVYLGVMNTLLDLWFSSTSHNQPYYISKTKSTLLDKKMLSLKLCEFIVRKPRSMIYRKMFKASELRTMLLFFLPECLNGILSDKYVSHFRLLSSAIYKLSCTSITPDNLRAAATELDSFVRLFEKYYGSDKTTMNIHLLNHLPICVFKLGPLWSFSMFSFESFNGILGSYFNKYTDINRQIVFRYILRKSLEAKKNIDETNRNSSDNNLLFPKMLIKPSPIELNALNNSNMILGKNNKLLCFARLNENSQVYTSSRYTRAKISVDYFVELEDGTLLEISYYFYTENKLYAMTKMYSEVSTNNHIREFRQNQSIKLQKNSYILKLTQSTL